MRYDKYIYIIRETTGSYNPVTGDYDDTIIEKEKIKANISPVSDYKKNLLFGRISDKTLNICIQNKIKKPFLKIEYEGLVYNVIETKILNNKQLIVVSNYNGVK